MAWLAEEVKAGWFLPARSDIPAIDFAKNFAGLPDLLTHAGEGAARGLLLRPRGAARATAHATAPTGAGTPAITPTGTRTQAPTNVTEIVPVCRDFASA